MDFKFFSSKNFESLSRRISFLYLDNSIMAMWTFGVLIMHWLLLLRKKEGVSLVNDFRPINLLNIVIKIITKVLANRLRFHIHLLVDQVQSAFTKNIYIFDGVVCTHEVLAATHNSCIEAVFLKLDF